MNTFHAKIITPLGEVFHKKVEAVSAPGEEGSFGVLYQHTPMIVKLKDGPFSATVEGGKEYYTISGGVLEVDENHNVMVLTDSAHPAEPHSAAKEELTH